MTPSLLSENIVNRYCYVKLILIVSTKINVHFTDTLIIVYVQRRRIDEEFLKIFSLYLLSLLLFTCQYNIFYQIITLDLEGCTLDNGTLGCF